MYGGSYSDRCAYIIAVNRCGDYIVPTIEFVLGYYEDGELVTYTMLESELYGMIKYSISRDRLIQNVAGTKDNKLQISGYEKDYEGALRNYEQGNKFVCLAEIVDDKDKTIKYILVDRRLKIRSVDRLLFQQLVSRQYIDNYYCTESGEVRRMPNQNVKYCDYDYLVEDTHFSSSSEDFKRILKSNGFRIGYKSPVFGLMNKYYKQKEYFQTFIWYDKHGAIVWYNSYLGVNKDSTQENIPYSGIKLIIDVNLTQSQCGIGLMELGASCSTNQPGHQRLEIDARENLVKKYTKALRELTLNNPWDFDTKPINSNYCFFYRKDYEKFIKDKAEEIVQHSKEYTAVCKEHGVERANSIAQLWLFGEASLIATHMTVNSISDYELKRILSNWNRTFAKRLLEEIESTIKHDKLSKQTIEKFLAQTLGVTIDDLKQGITYKKRT